MCRQYIIDCREILRDRDPVVQLVTMKATLRRGLFRLWFASRYNRAVTESRYLALAAWRSRLVSEGVIPTETSVFRHFCHRGRFGAGGGIRTHDPNLGKVGTTTSAQ
jgi:hypothetical protein